MKRPTSLALAVLIAGGAMSLAAPAEAATYSTGGGIGALYNAQGRSLGAPTSPEFSGHADRIQTFQGGAILWSAATGAHTVRGGIHAEYNARGGDAGTAGLPTSEETPAPGGGVLQHFQGATIYWSPTTGAHQVGGGIGAAHAATGGVGGSLGYPTSDEIKTAGGGVYQTFQRGTVYWSAATGAHLVGGGIGSTHASVGGVGGQLGYPTSEETKTAGGVYQTYQGGTVYWSPATGAHPLWGGIGVAYAAAGGATGTLGFPTSGETVVKYGDFTVVTQTFQGGMITWVAGGYNANVNPDPGHAHVITGAIYQKYIAAGGPAIIGPPLANATTTGTTTAQAFANAAIVSDPAVGTHSMWSNMYKAWLDNGGAAGKLGLPTSDVQHPGVMTAYFVQFQGGKIYSNALGVVQVEIDSTTASPSPTDTASPSPAPTDTSSPAPTDTASPSPTDTASPSPTDTATSSPTDTATSSPTTAP